jgi:ERCC4-type nuclease
MNLTRQNVLNASRDELLKVSGIGNVTVDEIKKLQEVFENGNDV